MARSQKGEDIDKSQGEKKDKRKPSREKRVPEFQTDVTLITQGKIGKGASISRDAVKKHSVPKKSVNGKKPVVAKFFKHKVEFKEKIILGNKKKKALEYDQVKMMEQLSSDSRMIFVNYETPKKDYFVVLAMKDVNRVKDFVSLVSEKNPKTEIRWSEALPIDIISNGAAEEHHETTLSDRSPVETYSENNNRIHRKHSLDQQSGSDSFRFRQQATTSSYICADPRVDDGTVYSRGTPDTFAAELHEPRKHSRRRDSYNSYDLNTEDDYRAGRLTTQYYYVGPKNEGDSFIKNKYKNKSKNSYSKHQHQYYDLDDDVKVSMTPSSLLTEVDYDSADAYGNDDISFAKIPPFQKTSHGRKPSRRPKSRELPLSEAEKHRGGWHSDVLFVTPTKDGGVKVSADGPVMLYTATRANVNRNYDSSDDDSTSDGESDFSYSSGSTLTLESLEKDEMPFTQKRDRINGRR